MSSSIIEPATCALMARLRRPKRRYPGQLHRRAILECRGNVGLCRLQSREDTEADAARNSQHQDEDRCMPIEGRVDTDWRARGLRCMSGQRPQTIGHRESRCATD